MKIVNLGMDAIEHLLKDGIVHFDGIFISFKEVNILDVDRKIVKIIADKQGKKESGKVKDF